MTTGHLKFAGILKLKDIIECSTLYDMQKKYVDPPVLILLSTYREIIMLRQAVIFENSCSQTFLCQAPFWKLPVSPRVINRLHL